MMVGGTIIGLTWIAEPREFQHRIFGPPIIRVHVHDTRTKGDVCCVDIAEPPGVSLAVGDAIWWQGDSAYWTPRANLGGDPGEGCGTRYDIRVPRASYSYNMGHTLV